MEPSLREQGTQEDQTISAFLEEDWGLWPEPMSCARGKPTVEWMASLRENLPSLIVGDQGECFSFFNISNFPTWSHYRQVAHKHALESRRFPSLLATSWFLLWLGYHAGPRAHTVLHIGKLSNKSWCSLYKWGFSSYIFYLVQNALRTDFLWVIVQFYAFARTQVFNKSDLWSLWSIFL